MPVSSLYKLTVRFLIWIAPWTCPPVFGDPPAEAEQSPFGEQQSSSDYPPLTFPGGVGDQWVYGNATAKALVEQARRYDPMDAKHDDHDREQAVELYEAAIESQPGAKLNAVLANRIAQMYGFYADPAINAEPIPTLAHKWWKKCVELTEPTQLLWGQAHMGMGSVDAIIEMDPGKIEPEPWLIGSKYKDSEWYRERREAQQKRVVELIAKARAKQRERLKRKQLQRPSCPTD